MTATAPRAHAAIVLVATFAVACGQRTSAPSSSSAPTPAPAPALEPAPAPELVQIPATPQRAGDPVRGRRALLGRDYVGCGVPRSLYRKVFGRMPASWRVPGRTGAGADLPYFLNAATSRAGVDIVTYNCLSCHAGFLDGELVIGLGAAVDFTLDPAPLLRGAAVAGMTLDAAERAELNKLVGRLYAVAPYVRTTTFGVNAADNLAAALFARRDPKTLAWSDEPTLAPPPTLAVPLDVPAWWMMRKKHAMFYTAAGRGDHARIMMTASTLCTDTVEDARAIDAYFGDIRAYIASLEPPPYPLPLAAGAARGEALFRDACERCHGRYGADESYPNLVVPLAKIGTDPLLAAGSGFFAARFIDWFNDSFYGETASLAPERGYVAPPLDGVWATAPYFHNGSVPTLAGVLDSDARPALWARTGRYDTVAPGLELVEVADRGPDAEYEPWVYDTRRPGHANAGHPFADPLSDAERADLLEYLKSL